MGSHGIRDRVAIVGMGCTRFTEHWDKGVDELLLASTDEAFASAGVTKEEVDAYWLGTAQSGMSGLTLSKPLRLKDKPVTRVENYCATGSEALRQAAYAVASGAYDVAMAVGVEKVKDSGYQGLNAFPIPNDGTQRTLTAAAMFSMVAPAYGRKYGVSDDEMRTVLARIASKNHANGARNPRAQFRKEMSVERLCSMPAVAGGLSVFDCAGVADGSAAAIVVRAEDAYRYTDKPLFIKALSFVAGDGSGLTDPAYDYTTFPEVAASARDAYAQAGISDPAAELAMAEVHDCFTPTELVLLEDLGLAERGSAWKKVLDGAYDLDGALPVNPDGGLKSFGHPVGASGLRMMFEAWLQLRGEAPDGRRISTFGDRSLALTHNLGGYPGEMVSFVSILGTR
ncbi:acetyl-CoA C-acetyltransferase [Actinocorallia herbida]|uniref:Acetyl-CoA C-acetyltransferase n=1 Tax=Actinocorallia herbida TaxID=58109 RepID=A0A3N1CUQ3_9ACTN|nr:acetyl-CoA acetyltransferase [Actinocorallia herbida]ROO85041.1 acetyl-CoA C-acetyltransferase [Actinocorallia herbida]